jgi:hypothetical protein
MKFTANRPYADPEAAARKLIELANSVEAVQDGRIHIEPINGPFLFDLKARPAECRTGLDYAIERAWLEKHESGTYVKMRKPRRSFQEKPCTACNNTGHVEAAKPTKPNVRIYPPQCKECLGKGRVPPCQ